MGACAARVGPRGWWHHLARMPSSCPNYRRLGGCIAAAYWLSSGTAISPHLENGDGSRVENRCWFLSDATPWYGS